MTTRRATRKRWTLAVATAMLALGIRAQGPPPAKAPAADDPHAHALYDRMVAALREAPSLRYRSDYRWCGENGKEIGRCTYTAALQKPNAFRIDTRRVDGSDGGVLVGDGRWMWMFWPGGRPFFSTEDPRTENQPRDHQYLKQPALPGRHSIGHQTPLLGAGMSMTIIDPSTFHGYTDSLQPYLDGVRSLGAKPLCDEHGDEGTCDVIEVGFMQGQRTWKLWLSRRDHLPRRLEQTVRVSYEIVTEERWIDVEVGAELAPELFAWTPPAGWEEWSRPQPEQRLLQAGEMAPDFAMPGPHGVWNKLSDFRGKVVWLVFWRVG